MDIRRSFLQQLKHTPSIPVCCAFISHCLVALRTMEIPPLLLCLFSVYIFEAESYVNDEQSFSQSSWNKAPIQSLGPDFYYCQTVAGLLVWGALSDERMGHLQLPLALASTVILGSEFRGTLDHILLSQIRDFPFCRLLQLAGLLWKYSTPPPHGITPSWLIRVCFLLYLPLV
jgi:hypothetical protein